MNRREFVGAVAAAAAASRLGQGAALSDSIIMLTAAEAERIRKGLDKAPAAIGERVGQFRLLADKELRNGPWSVAYHRPPNATFDPHEYYSEGPYFWPDPKNPKGPYMRKDGERNPARFQHNHNDLGAMSTAVLTLGLATFLYDDVRFAEHAAQILYTWFIDPQTRMNPDLEHGQAVPGVNDGRGTGLIDTVSLIHCAQGILLLRKSGKLEETLFLAVHQWFSQFLIWMTISPKGKAEEKSGNNHATWWTAQVAAYATLTGNSGALDYAWDRYRNYLVPEEIKPDGSCPREEARTNSLSYSVFNADAFAVLCRIAQSAGTDLWDYKSPKGGSYRQLVQYVAPFVAHPEKWKGQQISPFKSDSTVFLGLAGVGLKSRELLAEHRALPHANSAWITLIELILWGGAA
jgi:hypothetical protein